MDNIALTLKPLASHAKHRVFQRATIEGVLLLVLSLVVSYYAGVFAADHESFPVTDIILSNIRAFDVDWIFAYGPLLLWVFVAFLFLRRPQYIPFTLKSIALLILVRSVFVPLTHVGPFPVQAPLDYGNYFLQYFTSGADLFFSAHTALPFLMALLFWEDKKLRVFFTIVSILFGVVVLLGHYHYSIDVLSAYFITFAVFRMGEILFHKEERMFREGVGTA
ncbi:MAG: hypothetical protein A2675_02025 [Candidatus Yonathbacteria bacterium RIFCSPHIGHO2_01_FULL_51_10]|uniref:Sphingomyelin synthase-like domain-containing protein n=1 Tax=Candidatus Yonathbacteria bacterium RIFCSPHIGHO2_01_FULL_51_10 TaxID=1802723 RepID=A0A1G2SA45_9BACT|nr:MAG: hypothetical protein A2675_02025 [Candidatus Yonathbacteria bacterium RIFCSPHIGHO2_01_FULL_51_10]